MAASRVFGGQAPLELENFVVVTSAHAAMTDWLSGGFFIDFLSPHLQESIVSLIIHIDVLINISQCTRPVTRQLVITYEIFVEPMVAPFKGAITYGGISAPLTSAT